VKYLFNVALGLDLFASAVLGGIVGETLSGRAGKAYAQGALRGKFWQPVINFITRNPHHCQLAWKNDIARANAVIVDDLR
jgi:hypothetical protein